MKRILTALITAAASFGTISAAPVPDGWQVAPATNQTLEREMTSAFTKRTYRLLVSVPDAGPPEGGYPVLYLLDGHATFPVAAAINGVQGERGAALDVSPGIIVGIVHVKDEKDKDPRAEDFTPPAADLSATGDTTGAVQGGADRFLDFLEKELKPRIAADFQVSPQRQTLFGHSYGGLFTLHTLFTRPAAFQRYIAASPSIWWNNRFVLTERDAFIKDTLPGLKESGKVSHVVITVGDQEQTPLPHHVKANRGDMVIARRQVDNAKDLAADLAAAGVPVRFHLFGNENHGTARVPAINHALRVAFGN